MRRGMWKKLERTLALSLHIGEVADREVVLLYIVLLYAVLLNVVLLYM